MHRPPTSDPPGRGDAAGDRPGDPDAVPVWLPYLRGERTPFHDPGLRASLHDLDITHGPDAVLPGRPRGQWIRGPPDRRAQRASRPGGSWPPAGVRGRAAWMAAVADATGLPVETVGVPEGAALGAAFLARMAAGLETDLALVVDLGHPRSDLRPRPGVGRRRLAALPSLRGPRAAGLSGAHALDDVLPASPGSAAAMAAMPAMNPSMS